jgi:hypothetical protein
VARSAIARSGVQHKASRAAAQYLFSKTWIPDLCGGFAAACPGNASADVIYGRNVIYAPRAPDGVARSAIARSGVQHKASRAAAQYLFSKHWIPDRRDGFAATCPGNASADVIYAETSSMRRLA